MTTTLPPASFHPVTPGPRGRALRFGALLAGLLALPAIAQEASDARRAAAADAFLAHLSAHRCEDAARLMAPDEAAYRAPEAALSSRVNRLRLQWTTETAPHGELQNLGASQPRVAGGRRLFASNLQFERATVQARLRVDAGARGRAERALFAPRFDGVLVPALPPSTHETTDPIGDAASAIAGQAAADEVDGLFVRTDVTSPDDVAAMFKAERLEATCRAIANADFRADLPRLTLPTLMIGGSADPGTSPALMAETAALIGANGHAARVDVTSRASTAGSSASVGA